MAKYPIRLRGRVNKIHSARRAPVQNKSRLDKGIPGVSPTARMFAMLFLIVICLILGVDLSQLSLYQGILMS